jgi:hypothetical protein
MLTYKIETSLIMKKTILIIFLLCISCLPKAQVANFQLGETNFTIQKAIETYSENEERTFVLLSRNDKELLTHTILEIGADHNSMSLEIGDYEISDNTITFYSYWAWGGDAPVSPFGGRIQTYQIQKNGKLLLVRSQLYIEQGRVGFEGIHKGIQFLKEMPKSESDKKLFREYVSEMESNFNAKFVYGNQSDRLMSRIRKKIAPEIEKYTKDWNQRFKYGFWHRK